MAGIDNIDYSSWNNPQVVKIAETVDTDGKKGLQRKEVFNFINSATDNSIKKSEIYELMGLTLSNVRRSAASQSTSRTNPDFEKAVDYYNTKMNSAQRYAVTQSSYTKLEERLYKMEHDIDQAYIDCEAYSDIMLVPRWHYRYYPRWEDNLINFDIDDIRTRTINDMESLHQLKDKVEYIMEEANGSETHIEPEKTLYDVEALAQKHLGMSYEEFAEKYKDELDFCKTVTYADLSAMTSEQRLVYAKAKAYARDMLQTTVNEAHNVNWNVGERKLDETLKASGDMYTISEFEYDGITDSGLAEIKSGIMHKAFEEALIEKHRELDPTGINELQTRPKTKEPKKVLINGNVLLYYSDGSIYDMAGRKIK